LTFCACNLHQIAGSQDVGAGQHASGHCDFIIAREVLDYFKWRMFGRRQACTEFGPNPAFDSRDKNTQHLVEDFDLILAEALLVMQEKIGYPSKSRDPLLRRTAIYGVFEFTNEIQHNVPQLQTIS